MERYIPVAQTRPKPPRAWLLFLQAGYKRAVLGTTILSNGKEHFGPTDQNDQTFKADSEYSGRTKPKWSVLFDVAAEITGILGWMESAPGWRSRFTLPVKTK